MRWATRAAAIFWSNVAAVFRRFAMQPLLHSLRRDWRSWSRLERLGAAGVLFASPLLALLTMALTLGANG